MIYIGILKNKGKVVNKDEALIFAFNDIATNEEAKEEFLEWYYSGDWIEEDGDE